MLKTFLAMFAVISLLACTSARAEGLDRLTGLNSPDYHLVQSEVVGRPYHVFVRLPQGYGESETAYPVVYLLDGDVTFPLLGAYYQYLSFGEEVPDAILVGIAYGNDDWGSGNYRGTDYTAPAQDREAYGGAEQFQSVLRDEIIPLVETGYRADSRRRIIFGQSLGGQFVLYSALTDPDLFWGHIASNPALHRNLPFFRDFDVDRTPVASRVFVSSGSMDDPTFREPALAWFAAWSGRTDLPWNLMTVTLEGESHFSAAPQAFRRGMAWLFYNDKPVAD